MALELEVLILIKDASHSAMQWLVPTKQHDLQITGMLPLAARIGALYSFGILSMKTTNRCSKSDLMNLRPSLTAFYLMSRMET